MTPKKVMKSKLQRINQKNICIIQARTKVNIYIYLKDIYKSIIKIVNPLRKKVNKNWSK